MQTLANCRAAGVPPRKCSATYSRVCKECILRIDGVTLCRRMHNSFLWKRSQLIRLEENIRKPLLIHVCKEDQLEDARTSGPVAGVVVGGGVVGTLSGAVEALQPVRRKRDRGTAGDDRAQ